ncbi:MAG: hypothetical protein JNM98_10165, partial [Rhodocyclaceae bacterium]|nr:hypothetical protein [Rhodocyclaceae bacterium]
LASARHAGPTPAPPRLAGELGLAPRTLQRCCAWWRGRFAHTAWWQDARARFMPPVVNEHLPASLLERFTGAPAEALLRLLLFLRPLSVGRPIMLREGR